MGSGSGISWYTRLSSPPNFSNTIARIALLPLIGTDSGCAEVTDRRRDLSRMRFQREVARLEEADHGTWNVALERLGARRQEKRIVLAPHREERRPSRAEVFLELRVQRDIAGVVEEEVELDLVVAGPSEQRRVEGVALGRDQRFLWYAMHVLPLGRFGREETAERRAICGRGLPPVALDRVPALAQPLLIGVAILRDDR